jgi:hypothetical protein
MGQKKRIGQGAAVWPQLFSRQSSCGLSVPEFCRIRTTRESRSTIYGITGQLPRECLWSTPAL